VVRWEPGAPERLQKAALELFASQGFEETTAAQIAQSVGLTERTFFRYFSDKREVLFAGQDQFEQAFLVGMDEAPSDASPIGSVARALRSGAALFPDERRSFSRKRQVVIDQNPPLQEREQHKLSHLAITLAQALRGRGVDELEASLAARCAVTVFELAFARWISEGERRSLTDITDEVLHNLLALTRRSRV
jgi:AcrR family transcriptional regulator